MITDILKNKIKNNKIYLWKENQTLTLRFLEFNVRNAALRKASKSSSLSS